MGIDLLALAFSLWTAVQPPAPAVHAMPDTMQEIRVVLSDKGNQQQIGGELLWLAQEKQLGVSDAAVAVELTPKGVKLKLGQRTVEAERLTAKPMRAGSFCIWNGHSYRGHFEFFRGKQGGLIVLNVLPVEDYLLGVVPSEMPSDWPPEALRAQAVAARTFALSRMIDHMYDTYDVYDDQSAQVYLGLRGENKRTSQAVLDTRGQILTYEGAPIVAYFFSDSGGYTKDGKQPYLRAKPSKYAKSPHNSWRVALKPADLAKMSQQCGTDVGQVQYVACENDPVSGYLHRIIVEGAGLKCEISANKLRDLLGLNRMKSTRAWIESPQAKAGAPVPPSAEGSPPAPRAVVESVAEKQQQTQALEGWAKPSVATAKGTFALKLRNLFAWDGHDLERCNGRVYVWTDSADAAPPPAAAADTAEPAASTGAPASIRIAVGADGVVLAGTGYGHGLGMPQYGARALAEEGKDYREILLYFYTGVQLVNWDGSLARMAPQEEPTSEPAEAHDGFYRPFKWPKQD